MIAAGVIGWPVAHSKSPLIHRFWLGKLGIDGDYGRFAVAPENLAEALRGLPLLGLAGVNVTVPHKVAALACLDAVDATAQAVGAVNTVVVGRDGRLSGTNTDVDGIARPLAHLDLNGRDAVLIGAGGAARAALLALKRKGIAAVTVVNRTPSKAATLLTELDVVGLAVEPGATIDDAAIVINASVLGMAGSPSLDFDIAMLGDDTTVFDAVYAPVETPLLVAARARGLPTIDGLQMLVAQAAAAFELFYGAPAPREHDAELRARLVA